MTVDWFMPLRALLLWPMYLIITATGTTYIWNKWKFNLKHLIIAFLFFGLWGYHSTRTIETILYYQPYVHAGAYQYGFAQMVPYVNKLISHKDYQQVIIDSPHAQPHIFFLTFSAYSPIKYQEEIEWRVEDYTARTNFNFGPYTFREIYWANDRQMSNTLFVGDVESLPYDQIEQTSGASVLEEFKSPDGNISFRVVENK